MAGLAGGRHAAQLFGAPWGGFWRQYVRYRVAALAVQGSGICSDLPFLRLLEQKNPTTAEFETDLKV